MISVDDILEQLPRDGVYTLRDRVAQVLEIASKAAPVKVRPKTLGEPYALDAWPNEDEP